MAISYLSEMVQHHVLSVEGLVVVALNENVEFFGQLVDGSDEFVGASRNRSADGFQGSRPWCGGFSDAFFVGLGGRVSNNLLGAIAKVYHGAKAC